MLRPSPSNVDATSPSNGPRVRGTIADDSRPLAGTLILPTAAQDAESLSRLSARERGVLTLIADGLVTKEIAWRLGVSAKTVEAHRRHIMEKVSMEGVARLTKFAVRNGLSSLDS